MKKPKFLSALNDPKSLNFPRVAKIWANGNLGGPFFAISICKFQSMKSPVELVAFC